MRRLPVLFCLLILAMASGCATKNVRKQARDDFARGDFAEAEKKLASSDVVSEAKNRLLTLVSLGSIAHEAGRYEKSNLFFDQAAELAGQLYTTSISEVAATAVVNDNSQSYAGLDYEISMIYYYLAMNDLMIGYAGTPKEINKSFSSARTRILAWDSFLETVRSKNRGKPVYKDDVAAKLLGAYVHRLIGTREDRQIAKVLYSDVRSLLVKSLAMFPAFNRKAGEFRGAYRDFHKKELDEVRRKYLDATGHFDKLEKFVDVSARNLARDTKSTLVILDSGMIPEKSEKVFTVGLSTLIDSIEDEKTRRAVDQIGTVALLQFAPRIGIGVVALAVAGSVMSDENNKPDTVASAVDRAVGFEFKLPCIPEVPTDVDYKLVFKSKEGAETEVPLAVVNPVNDFASLEVEARSSAVAAKTGIRVGLKYLTGLVAAYAAYKAAESVGEYLAVLAAMATWIAAKKVVDATEAADVRAWDLLPQTISMTEVDIPPGKYDLTAVGVRGADNWTFGLGEVEITDKTKNIVKRRVLFMPPVLKPSTDKAAGLM